MTLGSLRASDASLPLSTGWVWSCSLMASMLRILLRLTRSVRDGRAHRRRGARGGARERPGSASAEQRSGGHRAAFDADVDRVAGHLDAVRPVAGDAARA